MKERIKGKTKFGKLILIVSMLLFFLIGISAAYAFYLLDKTKDIVAESYEGIKREENKSALRDKAVDPLIHNVSVLFIGIDTGEERNYGEASRSDALLLATFNTKDNTVKILSIPRDTYTYIPDLGYYTKINHAHFYGGAKSTMETVERLLHVPVDYYVRLNFDAFVEIVDTLDGIRYDVPFEIYEMDSHDKKNAIHLFPGEQTLNGEESLALARTRKYDNDMERGKRQQGIVKAIVTKATSPSSVLKLGNILDAIGPNISTNLTFDEMKGFLSYITDEQIDIDSLQLEGEGGYRSNGGWYFQVDESSINQISNLLREHLNLSFYYSRKNSHVEK